jgi:hypothetical protein
MAVDARGAEILVGDTVVYVSGGRYVSRGVARVEKVHAKKVAIVAYDSLRGVYGERPYSSSPQLVNGDVCFVVDKLPHVEGRLNK